MNRAPKSLAELKEVAGIGEAFCRDYGAAALELVAGVKEASRGDADENETGGRIDGIE